MITVYYLKIYGTKNFCLGGKRNTCAVFVVIAYNIPEQNHAAAPAAARYNFMCNHGNTLIMCVSQSPFDEQQANDVHSLAKPAR